MILQTLVELATSADAAAPQVMRGGVHGVPLFVILFSLMAVLVFIVKWGLIIWGIVWLVRYLKRGREERQLLRLELGKLADEVQLLRQGLDKSSAD